tara:strand:- start:376 stop:2319 length:1944 start_codon:yes stop_codon:yes gene_type:complete
MARDFVKDLSSVKQFNSELNKSKDTLDSLEGVGKDLGISLLKVADATNQSRKYSKENLDFAKQQSTAGKNILNVLNKQNKGGKLSTAIAKARLGLTRLTADKSNEVTQTLFDQYDAQQKVNDENKKQSRFSANFAKNLGNSVLKLIGMGGLIGGIVAAFKAFSNRVDELGTAFGVIGTKELRDDLIEAERQVTGIGMNLQDVITITSTLTDNFGLSTDEAANLSAKIADSGKALGLSVSESADLFGSLISIGQLSADQAENFAESTYQLAQANKVNPKAVMQDMAKSSQLIAKFGADNLQSISKAAIQARKLGLELSTVDSISSSLLNFQDSITKQFEAEVILGRRLDLQRARQLALTGDLSSMMDEVLKQVGGEAKFNKMNVLERQALADTIGVSVGEMAKLVKKTGELETPKSFFDMLGQDAQSSLTTLTNKFTEFGVLFVQQIGPPLEKAGQLLIDFLQNSGFIDKVIGKVTNFGAKVGEIMPKVEKFFETLGERIERTKTKVNNFIDAMMGIASTLKTIGHILTLGVFSDAGFLGLNYLFGGGGNGAEVINGVDGEQMNDFISRPGMSPQSFSPSDTIVGVKGEFVDLSPLQNAIVASAVDINPVVEAVEKLTDNMNEYFNGATGTAVRAIGAKTAEEITRLT